MLSHQTINQAWEELNQKHFVVALKCFNSLLPKIQLETSQGRRVYLDLARCYLARCYEGLRNYNKVQQFFCNCKHTIQMHCFKQRVSLMQRMQKKLLQKPIGFMITLLRLKDSQPD